MSSIEGIIELVPFNLRKQVRKKLEDIRSNPDHFRVGKLSSTARYYSKRNFKKFCNGKYYHLKIGNNVVVYSIESNKEVLFHFFDRHP